MNNIELATIYQKELDRAMIEESTSGWMELNQELMQYNGGNEIKIASVTMSGLGNYNRDTGFPKGNINLNFETHKMTQDRGRSFNIDAMDLDESGFVATAATIMAMFQREYVIPEIDAYRYSKIASLAMENDCVSYGYTPEVKTIFEKLTDDIATVQEKIGSGSQLIVTMGIKTANILNNSSAISKSLSVMDFEKGEISTKVQCINGIPLITVPSDRLKTSYKFHAGEKEEDESGFEAAEDALNINWLICAQNSVIGVSKTEKVRITDPRFHPYADAYKLDYRKYHDLWIPKNKLKGVFVNIKETKSE